MFLTSNSHKKWTFISTCVFLTSGVVNYKFGPDAISYKINGIAGYVIIVGNGSCPNGNS